MEEADRTVKLRGPSIVVSYGSDHGGFLKLSLRRPRSFPKQYRLLSYFPRTSFVGLRSVPPDLWFRQPNLAHFDHLIWPTPW
jgi:hypothetical protein